MPFAGGGTRLMPLKRVDKTPMPERDAVLRSHDFIEVNEGYNIAHARFEAERCLRCQDPVCIDGCPVKIPIPDFVHLIAAGDMAGAARILRSANPLPAICGRVCPQESQCEEQCSLGTRFVPVAIGYLERFVADWEMGQAPGEEPEQPARTEKVAIIGSGPAGLVCAGELARLGHPVTIFEGLHAPGGVLRYGIPEFRLPKEVLDWEIDQLKRLGVKIVCNVIIGKTVSLDDLFDEMGFSAVFVGTGAGLPQFMGIPGENLNGVYSANEFLTRVNLIAYSAARRCRAWNDRVSAQRQRNDRSRRGTSPCYRRRCGIPLADKSGRSAGRRRRLGNRLKVHFHGTRRAG